MAMRGGKNDLSLKEKISALAMMAFCCGEGRCTLGTLSTAQASVISELGERSPYIHWGPRD